MSERNRMQRLAERLAERTQAREISWSESVPKGSFLTSFPSYSVKIEPSGGISEYEYLMKIFGPAGEIIATTPESLVNGLAHPERIVPQESLEVLYNSVLSSLSREDELDKVLLELG